MSDIEGYEELRAKLAKFRDDIQRKAQDFILRLMKKQIDMMLERTRKGETINGGAFKPYSKEYAAYKRTVRPGYPDWLRLTDNMLNSMVVRLIRANTGEVLFGTPEAREKMMKNDKTRPFFGVNKEEENQLTKYYASLMFGVVKNVFR